MASVVVEKNITPENRLRWPDIAKGICMIAIVAGHLGNPTINRIVFLWHLPVFFLLAGYFMKEKPLSEVVKNKAKRLLVPYYTTCLIICIIAVIRSILDGTDTVSCLKEWIGASLYAAGDSWSSPVEVRGIGAIWFLWAMFIALLITSWCIKSKYGFAVVVLSAFCGWASIEYTGVWIPLSIQAGMLDALYLYIGYYFRKKGYKIDSNNIPLIICMLLISAWGVWQFKGFWLVHNYMGNGWADLIVSFFASSLIIVISCWIDKTVLVAKIFQFYGKNSLLILCLHIIEMNVLSIYSAMSGLIGGNVPDYMFLIITFLVKMVYLTIGVIAIGCGEKLFISLKHKGEDCD